LLIEGWERSELKDLEDRFALVEKRVQAIVENNRALATRVRELERELAQARREAQELAHVHVAKLHIREKIENILHAIESAGIKK